MIRFLRPLVSLLLALCLCSLTSFAADTETPTRGLVSLDDQPLGNRTPLVLVHGINPNPDFVFGWGAYLDEARKHPAYQQRYKTYQFRYDTSATTAQTGEEMRVALHAMAESLPADRSMRIAGLSLGGMLVRIALADDTVRAKVDRFIAIGVPFHGTPLASPHWLRAQIHTQSLFSTLRLTNRIAYGQTRKRFPHFDADFCWDNFDGAIPASIRAKQPCQPHYGPDTTQVPTITYAAFFGAEASDRQWLQEQVVLQNAPAGKPRRVPIWNRHVMFKLVRPSIAELPRETGSISEPEKSVPTPLAFNDGISPVSSQLWLGRFVSATDNQPLAVTQQWDAILKLHSTPQARLFEGIDHRDWLEGRTRLKDTEAVRDWLHPNAPPLTVNQWIIHDLMDDAPCFGSGC